MTDYGVRLSRKGAVALVTLDRPARRNAFDETMWAGIEEVTAVLAQDPGRAVVVTGAGEAAFCAGFDVALDNPQNKAMIESIENSDPALARKMLVRIRDATSALVDLPVPVVAALNGLTYGGGAELAVRCDLRVMDPEAVICFSEVRLGLMTDWGGGPALARLLGPSKAADLLLTARQVKAEEALSLGLVNRISSMGGALQEALDLAEAIGRNGPRSVRAALAMIRKSGDLTRAEALELETDLAAELIASGECLYGVGAFLEKKPPEFPDV